MKNTNRRKASPWLRRSREFPLSWWVMHPRDKNHKNGPKTDLNGFFLWSDIKSMSISKQPGLVQHTPLYSVAEKFNFFLWNIATSLHLISSLIRFTPPQKQTGRCHFLRVMTGKRQSNCLKSCLRVRVVQLVFGAHVYVRPDVQQRFEVKMPFGSSAHTQQLWSSNRMYILTVL